MNSPAKKRPLSPHLGIYRWQISSMLSILHRMSGVYLTLALPVLVVWLLFVAASDKEVYNAFLVFLPPMLGQIALGVIALFILWVLWRCINGLLCNLFSGAKKSSCGMKLLCWIAGIAECLISLYAVFTLRNYLLADQAAYFEPTYIWAGQAVLFLWTAAFFYHYICGIRHLLWDAGYFLSIRGMNVTGYLTLFLSAGLTIGIWLKIYGKLPATPEFITDLWTKISGGVQ